uniref:Uncharacterized protein n=1 Tax=Arundo donax TaxID=35708 RepID=A0A0A9BE11_ARUDO
MPPKFTRCLTSLLLHRRHLKFPTRSEVQRRATL